MLTRRRGKLSGPLNIADSELGFAGVGAAVEEPPLLVRYLRIVLRRKWVLISTIATFFILGLVITLLMTRQYSASTTIEIARESDRVVDIKGVQAESSPADIEFYQTQYGLLKSRSLSESVVRELKLADNERFFEMFGKDQEGGLFSEGRMKNSDADRQQRIRLASKILLDHLTVNPERLSRLVTITFTSPDPAMSATVADAWASNFIKSNLERRFEATSYARNFLENRLQQLRVKLEESERALVRYASAQKIITVPGTDGGERSIVAADLAQLNQQLVDATGDLIRVRSKVQSAGGAGARPEALSNVAINGMRQKRAEIAAEYAKVLTQFDPQYPTAQALGAQLRQLDKAIDREEARVAGSLRSEYSGAADRVATLQERVDSLKQALLDLRRRSIQYNIYQREVDTNRALYDGLLQRYKEIGVAGGVGTNNVSIVDPAQIPKEPSKPRLVLNMALALFLGGLLGIGLALALDQLDDAISDPDEVRENLQLPLLGVVPNLRDADPDTMLDDPKSPIVEAYLSVQTSLEFSTDHGVPKSLAVTSTRPSEGKSTTALAMARSLGRSGKRVVLVDGDMRSPSVHHLLHLNNGKGLSNYLAGSADLAVLVQELASDRMFVVTSGPQPPNAAELLTGPRLSKLIEELLTSFDHVVIDSPPVMGLADAPLITSRVEGTIFAVESHKMRVRTARVALERLRSAHARLLGTVLTKFEAHRAHFGYGYDYGYGYGEDHSKEADA